MVNADSRGEPRPNHPPGLACPPGGDLAPTVIVGIGAAAGGPDTVLALIEAIPPGREMAVVVVQSARPGQQVAQVDHLAAVSSLRVVPAEHGRPVQPETVYLVPPGQDVHIEGGVLLLSSPHDSGAGRRPIDRFFGSLARDQRNRSVAILDSQVGADGAWGIRQVNQLGGMAIVFRSADAIVDNVLLPVAHSDAVDHVLTASELTDVLLHHVDHHLPSAPHSDPRELQNQLDEIQHLLKVSVDLDFRHYKHSTLWRRVQRRMGAVGVASLPEYIRVLKERPHETEALAQDLLICVTQFLRNPSSWRILQKKVLRPLIDQRSDGQPIRVWVPGCATGEEAYTLAMLLSDEIESGHDFRVQIFATDISKNALKVARAARYPEAIASDIPLEWLQKYFVREADGYRIKKTLRELVVFAAHDLKGDPPFFRLDLISCRNLLIYLEPEAQAQILRKFHFALNPQGYLFLGGSETAGRYEHGFEVVDPKARLYRRVGQPTPSDLLAATAGLSKPIVPTRARLSRPEEPRLPMLAAQTFWRTTGSVVLLLNRKLQPMFVGGSTERYLQIAEGEQRYTIYELVRPGLQLKLRSAIQKAEAEGEASFDRVPVSQADGSVLSVRGTVRLVSWSDDPSKVLYVQLEPESSFSAEAQAAFGPEGENQEEVVKALERELLETREELSNTIEQLEQTNEELRASHEEAMSVNEELQSGTEELEASREELQSLNEELTTLNGQLEDKLRELEAANNDLDNLISSTRIAVVFLDTQFRVRNFTPEAVELFSLIRTDIGRPISDLVHKFTDGSFLDDARVVLDKLSPIQREVSANDRRIFLRRLLPYRTNDNRIEGVVATFQDITELKNIQHELARQQEQLRLVADSLPVLIAYIGRDRRYRFVNARYEEWFGMPVEEIVGKTLWELMGDEAYQVVSDKIDRVLAGEALSWETRLTYRYGGARVVHIDYVPNKTPEGETRGYYTLIQDVTQRHQAEDAMRKSEAEFRAIFELAGSGKFQADPKTGRFLRANRRFCGITGYSEEELQTLALPEITVPEDRAEVQGYLEALAQGASHHQTFECRIQRRDANRSWVLITGTVVHNDDQTPRFTIATVQDITARKLAEQALAAGEERLQIALATAHMGAWETDLETGRTIWDERIAKLLGLSPTANEDAPAHWIDFVHPEDRARVSEAYQQVADGRRAELEMDFRIHRSDGSLRWLTGRGIAQLQPEARRIVGVLQDITDRKMAEQALRESESRFRDLADNIAQLAWTADRLGHATWYNRRWYEYTGSSLEEVRQRGWQRLIHPDAVERVVEKLRQSAEEETVWEDTFPVRRHDGEYRWFLTRAVPIRDVRGEVVRWFGTNTDITDQMELERALKEADRRKDEFLAMLAHELRNPLAPIRSGIDLLMMDPRSPQEPLEVMEQQVRHLVRLVDDLLDVSRITRGKVDLRKETVALQSVVKKAVHAIQPNMQQKELHLQLDLPDEPIWLNADPVRLAQVFENLMVNAVKYTEKGGHVAVRTDLGENDVTVLVHDDGIGIDQELMPRVFELFTQSSRSFDREQGGLGIGLTIVKNLVELHDGSVEVRSEGAGMGSEFRVHLPVCDAPPTVPVTPQAFASQGNYRILIVDDNQSARHLLSRLLEAIDRHEIVTAASGYEALGQVGDFQPQIVLLDIGLPEMDGYEVARRIRQADPEGRILLVAVTGYGQNEDRQKSQAAGFDVHLVKPVGIDDLRELLIHPKLVRVES